jgi:hypothetical protein
LLRGARIPSRGGEFTLLDRFSFALFSPSLSFAADVIARVIGNEFVDAVKARTSQ